LPSLRSYLSPLFSFTDPPTTETSTLSLHDALPICHGARGVGVAAHEPRRGAPAPAASAHRSVCRARVVTGAPHGDLQLCLSLRGDRKSTRLNSSHLGISYAVFCLKKKKKNKTIALE